MRNGCGGTVPIGTLDSSYTAKLRMAKARFRLEPWIRFTVFRQVLIQVTGGRADWWLARRPVRSPVTYSHFNCAPPATAWFHDVGGPALHHCLVVASLFVHLSQPHRDVGGRLCVSSMRCYDLFLRSRLLQRSITKLYERFALGQARSLTPIRKSGPTAPEGCSQSDQPCGH